MAKDSDKGLTLAVLGVVAVLAVVGLVLLFRGGSTGQYVYEGGIAQWNPNEACQDLGGSLIRVEGGIDYRYRGPLLAVCQVGTQQIRTPLIRPFDWRTEYHRG